MIYVCWFFSKDHWEDLTDVSCQCIINLALKVCHYFVDKRIKLLLYHLFLLNHHFFHYFLPFFLRDKFVLNATLWLYLDFFNIFLFCLFHICPFNCFLIHFNWNLFLLFTLFFYFSLNLYFLILLNIFLHALFNLNFHLLQNFLTRVDGFIRKEYIQSDVTLNTEQLTSSEWIPW